MLEPIDRPAPTDLLLPWNDIPNLFKKEKESCAVALVRAFEDKFVHCKTHILPADCGLRKLGKRLASLAQNLQRGALHSMHYVKYKKEEKTKAIAETMTDLCKLGIHNKPPKGSWFEVVLKLANKKVK
jgi:hypothetical protein